MSKSNPLPDPDQTRARIIEAASRLFTEKGYAGTSTRAISELAGVNEVTLFRHFGTKENLARAVVDRFGGPALAGVMKLQFTGDYVQDLIGFGSMLMNALIERIDVLRMAICEAGNFPEMQQIVAENPRHLRVALAGYLQQQMDAGVIRKGHAEVMAQAFMGMFFSYAVLEGFLFDSPQPSIAQSEVIEQFVRLFVDGTLITQEQ